jgi:hypothetical protein
VLAPCLCTVNALTDLLRLLCLPLFGWAAVRDIRTRRVPNRAWLPLLALGVALLAWDFSSTLWGPQPLDADVFALRAAISIGVVAPFGVLFWRVGAFGGADAKALAVLCLLFPSVPSYFLFDSLVLPLAETSPVFSLTVLTNAALIGGAIPLVLFARNALAGRVRVMSFLGRPVCWREIPATHGRLLAGVNGLEAGLDLDALRMYLRWRGASLETLPGGSRPFARPREPSGRATRAGRRCHRPTHRRRNANRPVGCGSVSRCHRGRCLRDDAGAPARGARRARETRTALDNARHPVSRAAISRSLSRTRLRRPAVRRDGCTRTAVRGRAIS